MNTERAEEQTLLEAAPCATGWGRMLLRGSGVRAGARPPDMVLPARERRRLYEVHFTAAAVGLWLFAMTGCVLLDLMAPASWWGVIGRLIVWIPAWFAIIQFTILASTLPGVVISDRIKPLGDRGEQRLGNTIMMTLCTLAAITLVRWGGTVSMLAGGIWCVGVALEVFLRLLFTVTKGNQGASLRN